MEAISFRSVSQVQLFFFIWELVHCLANQCLKGKKETAASIGLLSTIRAAAWSGSMHLQKNLFVCQKNQCWFTRDSAGLPHPPAR